MPDSQHNLYSLCFGVNQHTKPAHNLNCAAQDAEAVHALIGQCFPEYKRTGYLLNDMQISDKQTPTRENFFTKLTNLADQLDQGDVIVCYFACHAFYLYNGTELKWFLLDSRGSLDVTNNLISLDDIFNIFDSYPQSNRATKLFILDTCHCLPLGDKLYHGAEAALYARLTTKVQSMKKAAWLAACSPAQVVTERGHSSQSILVESWQQLLNEQKSREQSLKAKHFLNLLALAITTTAKQYGLKQSGNAYFSDSFVDFTFCDFEDPDSEEKLVERKWNELESKNVINSKERSTGIAIIRGLWGKTGPSTASLSPNDLITSAFILLIAQNIDSPLKPGQKAIAEKIVHDMRNWEESMIKKDKKARTWGRIVCLFFLTSGCIISYKVNEYQNKNLYQFPRRKIFNDVNVNSPYFKEITGLFFTNDLFGNKIDLRFTPSGAINKGDAALCFVRALEHTPKLKQLDEEARKELETWKGLPIDAQGRDAFSLLIWNRVITDRQYSERNLRLDSVPQNKTPDFTKGEFISWMANLLYPESTLPPSSEVINRFFADKKDKGSKGGTWLDGADGSVTPVLLEDAYKLLNSAETATILIPLRGNKGEIKVDDSCTRERFAACFYLALRQPNIFPKAYKNTLLWWERVNELNTKSKNSSSAN